MIDWRELFEQLHRVRNTTAELVMGPPANEAQLNELYAFLGFKFPAEFDQIHLQVDGVGLRYDGHTEWDFPRLSLLPQFIDFHHFHFARTHPELVHSYFPFYSFHNGDTLGYMLDTTSHRLIDGLFAFYHEVYRHSRFQSAQAFIRHAEVSIEHFLRSVLRNAKSSLQCNTASNRIYKLHLCIDEDFIRGFNVGNTFTKDKLEHEARELVLAVREKLLNLKESEQFEKGFVKAVLDSVGYDENSANVSYYSLANIYGLLPCD